MDPDVADLVRQERLVEAAHLTSERGNHAAASVLYERACDWKSAGAEALRAGNPARAIELAVNAGDDATAEKAIVELAARASAAESAAGRLARCGHHAWSARVLEGAARPIEAARAWERAGEARRAATLLEGSGESVEAARVLEAALRRDPQAWGAAAALGTLLGRFGNWQAAVRILQRIPIGAPERREALAALVPALAQLDLAHAAKAAALELDSLGGRPAPETAADPPRAAVAPRHRLFGRYDLVREVASSPSARVLECIDVVRGERVAIKIFAAGQARGSGRDALARFEREVRAMKSLGNASVVPLYDYIPEPPAIVLAWMGGGTLEQMLSREPIAPLRGVEIAVAVLTALGEAHRLGILHRDVKPANVLFDDSGGPRLGDFGVAHLGDLSTTATAGTFGTLSFMSPEQRQARPASARSDIFAVGVMLREMLTGERSHPDEVAGPAPSEAHRELDARHDAAVARLAALDEHARPADAFEARAILTALPWPATVDAARRTPARGRMDPVVLANTERLEIRSDGTTGDRWTGRDIEPIALTDRVLGRARAFALAGHPALQAVWRVDRTAGALWVEALGRATLDRPLASDERSRLTAALSALHAAGAVHGRVDREHIVIAKWGVVLRFEPAHDPTATVDGDWIALSRL